MVTFEIFLFNISTKELTILNDFVPPHAADEPARAAFNRARRGH
jgi:hypothetical protein